MVVRPLDKPSPDGKGFAREKRPILLYRSLFRVWARIRQAIVRAWQTKHMPDAFLANLAGRQPGDAVWRATVRSCIAPEGPKPHGFEALWDISKAFDRVGHARLMEQARDMGYPIKILASSIASYRCRED